MGNLKSLEDEITAAEKDGWCQQDYDRYVVSLTPEERHTHFQRLIGLAWAMGDNNFAIRAQVGYTLRYGHERRRK